MEIIKLQQQIVKEQINLISRFLALKKEIILYENFLAGSISQADLLMNRILEKVDRQNDVDILNIQNELYEKILIKKYSQHILSNNQLFFNIFKAQDVTEIEKRIDKFLEKNNEITKEKEYLQQVLELIRGNSDGSK